MGIKTKSYKILAKYPIKQYRGNCSQIKEAFLYSSHRSKCLHFYTGLIVCQGNSIISMTLVIDVLFMFALKTH